MCNKNVVKISKKQLIKCIGQQQCRFHVCIFHFKIEKDDITEIIRYFVPSGSVRGLRFGSKYIVISVLVVQNEAISNLLPALSIRAFPFFCKKKYLNADRRLNTSQEMPGEKITTRTYAIS